MKKKNIEHKDLAFNTITSDLVEDDDQKNKNNITKEESTIDWYLLKIYTMNYLI